MKIIVFDERTATLKHALQSALAERDNYVFVRLNPHISSETDRCLSIDFICFGKSSAPSLKHKLLATTFEELQNLISGNIPSLVQLASQKLPKYLNIPSHVINRLL